MTKILDGKLVAKEIESTVSQKVASLTTKPTLGIIHIGNNPASSTYINQKVIKGEKIGIKTTVCKMPEDCSMGQLSSQIRLWNKDDQITGIIVQLPLPAHLSQLEVMGLISPHKDADGLTPKNLGLLLYDYPLVVPATSRGILSLLDYYNIDVAGKKVLVLGRSALVGKPTAICLTKRNATVTLAHSKTEGLQGIAKHCDIIISATGQPGAIDHNYCKDGVILIDVGTTQSSGRLVGDIDHQSIQGVAAALSPVPGGVGPLTVISLFQNVLDLHSYSSSE